MIIIIELESGIVENKVLPINSKYLLMLDLINKARKRLSLLVAVEIAIKGIVLKIDFWYFTLTEWGFIIIINNYPYWSSILIVGLAVDKNGVINWY